MRGGDDDTAALLAELYRGATTPDSWPYFLARLAERFNTGLAALRIVGLASPVAYSSWTVGIDDEVGRRYPDEIIERDVFREALSAAPIGRVLRSHEVICERSFRCNRDFEHICGPSGRFYTMGTHVARMEDRAVHIGIHRRRSRGPFTDAERDLLEFFAPHLGQAVQMMQMLGQFKTALQHSCAALDTLACGVWLTDAQLRCHWSNRAADSALESGVHGLRVERDVLTLADVSTAFALREAARRVTREGPCVQTLGLGSSGAALMLVAEEEHDARHGFDGDGGVTVFLLDPDRPLTAHADELQAHWGLTPAEVRLLGEFLRGLDVGEASISLGISSHTGRAQLKSIMHKVGVNRQPELMRRLLLGGTGLGLARR